MTASPILSGAFLLADDILSRSAVDLVALYRSKRVSPVEVLRATLERIDRLDCLYNAFVMIDREGALRDARASEGRWWRGEPNGLVDGLPVTVKDLILVKGMPTRRGSRTTSPLPSEEDGPPVARMRQQGAIRQRRTLALKGPESNWSRPPSGGGQSEKELHP
jgi:aspartyl-tRNA(Asn)/glutamyl-tRNA(Gln) amidotransferase subunit A